MDKKYTDIWKLAEDVVTAIETMQEADRKMGFCQDNLIPSGYEDSVEDLRQHAEDVRDFYFEGEPDGEGGECAVGSPVEWVREDHEAKRAETKQLMKDISDHPAYKYYASKY